MVGIWVKLQFGCCYPLLFFYGSFILRSLFLIWVTNLDSPFLSISCFIFSQELCCLNVSISWNKSFHILTKIVFCSLVHHSSLLPLSPWCSFACSLQMPLFSSAVLLTPSPLVADISLTHSWNVDGAANGKVILKYSAYRSYNLFRSTFTFFLKTYFLKTDILSSVTLF